jgi:hypothetical protein
MKLEEKNTQKQKRHDPELLIGIYKQIDETMKKRLFSFVKKHLNTMLKNIAKKMPGQRSSSIVSRNGSTGRLVDNFLENPKHLDYLEDLFGVFLNNYTFGDDSRIIDHVVVDRITQKRIDLMLDQINDDDGARDLIASCFDIGFIEFEILDDAFEPVLQMTKKYFEISEFYQGDFGELVTASEDYSFIDPEIIDRLVETNNMVVDLISTVQQESGKYLGEKLNWNTKDELTDIIDKIESVIDSQVNIVEEPKSSFLSEYVEVLKTSSISHTSSVVQNVIRSTRDNAIQELEEISEVDDSLPEFIYQMPSVYFNKLQGSTETDISNAKSDLDKIGLTNFAELLSMLEHVSFISINTVTETESTTTPKTDTIVEEPEAINENSEEDNSSSKTSAKIQPKATKSLVKPQTKMATPKKEDTASRTKELIVTEIAWDDLFKSLDYANLLNSIDELQQIALHLVERGHYAIAFHLLKAIEHAEPETKLNISTNVVRALSLSLRVNYRNSQLTSAYDQVINELSPTDEWLRDDDAWTEFHRYILFSCALWTGVAAPSSINDQLLPNLNISNFPEISRLIPPIVQFSKLRLSTDPKILKSLHFHTDWEDHFKTLKRETEEWIANARRFKLMYKPATQLWQRWIKDGGCLSYFLTTPIKKKSINIDKFEQELKDFDFTSQLESDEKSFLHHPLEGKSKVGFLRHVDEAIERVDKIVEMLQARPTKQKEKLTKSITILEESLKVHSTPILEEVESRLNDSNTPFQIRVALTVMQKRLLDTMRFFIDHEEPRGAKDILLRAERQELMLIPSLRLDKNWMFEDLKLEEANYTELLNPISTSLRKSNADPMGALDLFIDRLDFLSARRLIDWAQAESLPEADIEIMQNRYEDERVKARSNFKETLFDCENQLTRAGHNGLIQEKTLLRSQGNLQDINTRFDAWGDYETFYEDTKAIEDIKRSFTEDKDSLMKSVKQRIKEAKHKKSASREIKRVEKIAKEGNLHIANDYLDRIFDDQTLPTSKTVVRSSHFHTFYIGSNKIPAKINTLYAWLENKQSESLRSGVVVQKIKNGSPFAELNRRPLPAKQRAIFAHALETWFTIKKQQRISHLKDIELIFTALGFSSVVAKHMYEGSKSKFTIKTDPINAGTISCYGSDANGKYTLINDYITSSPEQLISAIDRADGHTNEAIILFYFGRMRQDARLLLERESRRLRRTVIVLDDMLMIYLATVISARISALLECTMPYTHFKPYTITASILPPEMFYGRREEIAKLESTSHDCSFLLYGGRQIGKTVLLRHVQKKVNQPDLGSIARFIDLKRFSIGLGKPIEEIWIRMMMEIDKEGLNVFKGIAKKDITPEIFSDSIVEWLNEDSSRRILLLLDEADGFLRADAENADDPYFACTWLKGIMEQTNRRFKIVLSGLHNVQRSTRVANNPLAHLGTPLNIGPMIHKENIAAQELVEVPLATMGIQFEEPDLIIQVLAQANYYPNLIQIYCSTIMDYVTEKRDQVKQSRDLLPYILKAVDLKNIYERQQLHDILRERFKFTLDLDPRFKLIASLLAFHNDEKEEQGFTSEWIREFSLVFWQKGFSEPSGGNGTVRVMGHDDFINILEEMIGLGILRKTEDENYYDLRSPNILPLLGNSDYLSNIIEEAENLELPEYSAVETLRAPLKQSTYPQRSALTAQQENVLKVGDNSTYLVIGTKASGLSDLYTSLDKGFYEDIHVVLNKNIRTKSDIITEIVNFRKAGTNTRNILLLPSNCDWDASWVDTANSELNQLDKVKVHLSIVFIADGEHLWKHPKMFSAFRPNRVLTLSPWTDEAVRHWFNDTNLGNPDPEMRRNIQQITGFWPTMLYKLSTYAKGAVVQGDTIKQFEDTVCSNEHVSTTLESEFEIIQPLVIQVFEILAMINEPMQPDDIVLMGEGTQLNFEDVQHVLIWADKLKYIRKYKGGWMLDSFLSNILNLD